MIDLPLLLVVLLQTNSETRASLTNTAAAAAAHSDNTQIRLGRDWCDFLALLLIILEEI